MKENEVERTRMAEIRKAEILTVAEEWKNYFLTFTSVPIRALDPQHKEPNILGVGNWKGREN